MDKDLFCDDDWPTGYNPNYCAATKSINTFSAHKGKKTLTTLRKIVKIELWMKLDYLDYDLSCDLTVWLNFAVIKWEL